MNHESMIFVPDIAFKLRPILTMFMLMTRLARDRYLSGCTTFRADPEGALFYLDALLDASQGAKHRDDYLGNVASASHMARAHSCAAHAHYQKFRAPPALRVNYAADERYYGRPETLDARGVAIGQPAHVSLAFALHHASESARLGLVSAIVLRVGFTAREIGEGLGVDFGLLVRRSRNYRPLWHAIDDRLNELYADARGSLKREPEATDGDTPAEYVCAADGCDTRSTGESSTPLKLKACAGRCPPTLKPRYCSKQCQIKVRHSSLRLPHSAPQSPGSGFMLTSPIIYHWQPTRNQQDWSRHKEICRPGGIGKVPKIPNRLIALQWFTLEDPEPEPAPVALGVPKAESRCRPVQAAFPQLEGKGQPDGNDAPESTADAPKPPKEEEGGAEGPGQPEAVLKGAGRVEAEGLDRNLNVPRGTEDLHGALDDEDAPSSSQGFGCAPPWHRAPSASSCLTHGQPADRDHRQAGSGISETKENAQQDGLPVRESLVEESRRGTRRVGAEEGGSTVAHGQYPHECEATLSSHDCKRAPPSRTPPDLLRGSPRPLVFGSITPEYLRKIMREEEGRGALADTGEGVQGTFSFHQLLRFDR